jgi:integrase
MRSRTSGIRTEADGTKTIDKRFSGERIFIRLGKISQDDAERRLAEEIALIQAKQSGARRSRPFREAAHRYLTDCASKASIEAILIHVEHLLPFIGDLPLEQVHDGTLQGFKDSERARGVSETTIKRALEVARRVLILSARKYRDEQGRPYLDVPPLIEMPDTRSTARKPYPLTWDEQSRLIKCLPQHLQEMALFAVNTGCREQEVVKLRWRWEIRLPEIGASVFLIPHDFGGRSAASGVKNREDRLVVLNEVARSVIEGCRGRHPEFVFVWRHGPSGPWLPTGMMNNTAWQRGRERAWQEWAQEMVDQRAGGEPPTGFRHVRVHDLKHTFGRRWRARSDSNARPLGS